jgi:peroxiredoxin
VPDQGPSAEQAKAASETSRAAQRPTRGPNPAQRLVRRFAPFLGVALLGYLGAVMTGPEHAQARPGAAAADFTLPDLQGRAVSLHAFSGHPTLVNFWATWCPPCNLELPDLQRLAAEHPGCLSVVGVALESGSAEQVAAFARRKGLTYPLVLDDGVVARSYQVESLPRSVLLDGAQRVVKTWDGVIDPAEVLEQVRALGPGVPRC